MTLLRADKRVGTDAPCVAERVVVPADPGAAAERLRAAAAAAGLLHVARGRTVPLEVDPLPRVLDGQEWVQDPACVRLFATPTACSLAYEKHRDPGALVTSGTVYPRVYEAPAELADLAQRMVGSLGGGLMGVDVLVEPSGRLLALEANAPFGFDVTDPEQGRWVARAALGRL